MSEPNKAVFLSYASQDAAAALRICEALRAAGVEVWFDQSELRGGDTWDAKIRRQIKECALFVPVISANTQARGEGYFRLEWKLAVDRSHLMAEDTAFIFPVIIDDVPTAAARVPDKFREVQWTRLRLDETPAELAGRVARLLSGEAESVGARLTQSARGAASSRKEPRPAWLRIAWSVVGLLFAVVFLVRPLWRSVRHSDDKPIPTADIARIVSDAQSLAERVAKPAGAPAADVPSSRAEARQLAAKAEELIVALDSTRDDFALAEDMLKQAVAKAPDDAEVWAAYAYLHERYGARGWDPNNERRELARSAVQRALRLDPRSFEARFAAASLYTDTSEKDKLEREQALRALLQERPNDKRVIRALAAVLRFLPNRVKESVELYDRAANLPGGDPLALYNKALALWFMGRVKEADTAVAAAIAQEPFLSAKLLAAYFALTVEGDLDRAKRLFEELPTATVQDDRGCYFGYLVYVYRGDPDQALTILQSFSRDWLNDSWYHGPKGLLTGNVLAFAGRPEAAAIEWRAALKLVDLRLAANPNYLLLLGTKLELLAKLGDRAAARQLLPAVRQMMQATKSGEVDAPWYVDACVAMDDRTEAMRVISLALQSKRHAVLYPAAHLRYYPEYNPLRDDPEFLRLIAEAERLERADASAASAAAPGASHPGANSVAVLAFANLSDDKANEYFSDGISEELLTVLQKIPGLHVAARTSAFSFKGKDATAQEIGERLGVATLVEGSVRKAGNSVRITARLSRAATGEQLWSESYTRELKDVFAVQSELAETIVGQLRGQLGTAGSEQIKAQVEAAEKGGTKNVEAHELYLQGKYFANRASMEDNRRAIDLLRRAVKLDPNFALGWAALSGAGWFQAGYGDTRADFDAGYALAHQAADKAIALEPEMAAGWLARLDLQDSFDLDWKGATESLQRAQALAPNDPGVVFRAAELAFSFGEKEKAVKLIQQAVALDPVNSQVFVSQGYFLIGAGRFREAEAAYRRVAELSPMAPWAHGGPSMALTAQGRFPAAEVEARKETTPWARHYALALALWGLKHRAEADQALAELIKSDADVAAYQIATVYAYRRETDQALAWLERAHRQRDGGLSWCQSDFFLENLHADPRWPAFLKSVGFGTGLLR